MVAVLAAGCVQEKPGVTGTTSLAVTLNDPADPGSFENRLQFDSRDVTVSIEALDAQGQLDTSVTKSLDVYVHFLGSLTPKLGQLPLTTVQMTNGKTGNILISLPPSYGPTFLWVEDTEGDNPSYATGTSPTLWYRNPYLEDISRPVDEMALDALERSPLEEKQVLVNTSRYGDSGRLVVTGVYAQGYTLSDVNCADANGTPPCVTGDYDHVFVFSFSRPEDQDRHPIQVGQQIDQLTGAISEFNGLTEVNFPDSIVNEAAPNPAMVPAPIQIQPGWFTTKYEMERVEEALVSVVNAEVCPLDDDYDTYSQWKLDVGLGCGTPINVISKTVAPDFDPASYTGMVLPEVVGTLRPVNIGSFNVWIIYPRDANDITTP